MNISSVSKSVLKERVSEDANKEALGPCHRPQGNVQTKERMTHTAFT